jgi:hypothetical protein
MALVKLPYEMITHIVNFVKDKIGLSMTCKLFDKLVLDIYKSGKLSNVNDSYYLKHLSNYQNIDEIYNHNCLNLVMYRLSNLQYSNLYFPILARVLETKNISKPEYIATISKKIIGITNIGMKHILHNTITYKSYDILKIIMSNSKPIEQGFLVFFLELYQNLNIEDTKKEMTCMIENDVVSYKNIYHWLEDLIIIAKTKHFYVSNKNIIMQCNELLEYIKNDVNDIY